MVVKTMLKHAFCYVAPPAKIEGAAAELALLATQHFHLLPMKHQLLHRPGVPMGTFVKRPPHT